MGKKERKSKHKKTRKARKEAKKNAISADQDAVAQKKSDQKKAEQERREKMAKVAKKMDKFIEKAFEDVLLRVDTRFSNVALEVAEQDYLRDKIVFVYFCTSIINREKLLSHLAAVYPEHRELMHRDMLRMAQRLKKEITDIEDIIFEDMKGKSYDNDDLPF
ncbi:hypothetical protein [Hugenholtzia roseola]|uniref:hypothetical protein n=1 Tax=Hugenholtzia roseola TaxID=1002 RepID=UPI00040BF435|nr:hypothetical protein [Hugenholtzia roseola]